MRRGLSLAAILSVTLLAACSPVHLLGWMRPEASGGEARDIAYAPGPRHAMDIYMPAKGARPPPVVVFFYGGRWRAGDRTRYSFVGRSLADCGAMTIIPDYRLWPQTRYAGFLRDAAEAVAFAREEARRRGGDTSRLFLMGHSAGAYIATMLALDPEWLAGAGMDARTALSGVIGLAGPYDFLPIRDPVYQDIFTPDGPRTQPITFAANASSPMLLVTGANDRIVEPDNSMRLAGRVRDTGGQVSTIVYPHLGHIGLVVAYSPALRWLAPVRDDTCRFLGLPASGTVAMATHEGSVAR